MLIFIWIGWNDVQEFPLNLVCVPFVTMEDWNVDETYGEIMLGCWYADTNCSLFDDVIGEHEPIFFI